jgi:GNAT superfamily N-acetyltransferase
MSLVVEKVDKNNFDIYQNKILKSLKEEYKKTYNIVIDSNQINKLHNYCISHMYVLIFKSHKQKLLGYFSLSRRDLNKSQNIAQYITNYILGTVYLFDVYIHPNYRNKGIGTYLVSKAVQEADKEYNANNIYLYTKTNKLTKFYNRNKFNYIKNVQIDNNKLLLFQRIIKN